MTRAAEPTNALKRLARGIAFGEGFDLHLLICDDPVVAEAAFKQVIRHVEATGRVVTTTRIDPTGARGHSPTFDELAARVIKPLLVWQRPRTDGVRAIVAIDAAWVTESEIITWARLLRRFNEVRNALVRALDAALVWICSPSLYRLFATEAPDTWSLRSATATVEINAGDRWLPGAEAASGYNLREIIGRLKQMPDDELGDLLDRIRLPSGHQGSVLRQRHTHRTTQIRALVDEMARAGRLREIAVSVGISRPGQGRPTLRHGLQILQLAGPRLEVQHRASGTAMVRELLADARRWIDIGLMPILSPLEPHRIDLVCITGDLVAAPTAANYELVTKGFIEPLSATLDVPTERIFWVPGTTDIDVDIRVPAVARNGAASGADEGGLARRIDALLADPQARTAAFAGLRHYADFSNACLGPAIGDGEPSYYVTRRVQIAGVSIGVACLNSVWQHPGVRALGAHWLGRRQLVAAREALADVDVRIALIHDGFAGLHPAEADFAAAFCTYDFDLVLHGPSDNTGHALAEGACAGQPAAVIAAIPFGVGDEEHGYRLIRIGRRRQIRLSTRHPGRFLSVAATVEAPHAKGREYLRQGQIVRAASWAQAVLDRSQKPTALANGVWVLASCLMRTLWEMDSELLPRDQWAPTIAAIDAGFARLQGTELPATAQKQLIASALYYSACVDDAIQNQRAMTQARELGVRFDSWLDTGVVHQLEDDSLPAVDAFLARLPADTHPWRRRYTRVWVLMEAGLWDAACTEAQTLSDTFPGRPMIDALAAEVFLRAGQSGQALVYASRVADMLPGIGHHLRLARCRGAQGDTDGAWGCVVSLLDREHPAVLLLAAQIASSRVDFAEASSLWARYLLHSPHDAVSRQHRARMLFAMGDIDTAAAEAWRASAGDDPGNCDDGGTLDAEQLYVCALLVDQGAQSEEERASRIRHLAGLLKQQFPGDAQAEQYLLQLQLRRPLDKALPQVDIQRLIHAGRIRKLSTDDAQTLERQQRIAKEAYKIGHVSAESMCLETGRYVTDYAAQVVDGSAFFAFFQEPSPTLLEEGLAPCSILSGVLELSLLDALGLVQDFVDWLRRHGCRLCLFDDEVQTVHDAVLATGAERLADDPIHRVHRWIGSGIRDGWLRTLPRPGMDAQIVADLPRERPGSPLAPRCRIWIADALSWFAALERNPELRLLRVDFFTQTFADQRMPVAVLSQLVWTPSSYERMRRGIDAVKGQQLDFAQLMGRISRDADATRRAMAKMGIMQAVRKEDLTDWIRRDDRELPQVLSGMERIARCSHHAGGPAARTHLTLLYARVIWILWESDGKHAQSAACAQFERLLARIEDIALRSHHPRIISLGLELLLLSALDELEPWFRRDEETSADPDVDRENSGKRLIDVLMARAAQRDQHRYGLDIDIAMRRVLLQLDTDGTRRQLLAITVWRQRSKHSPELFLVGDWCEQLCIQSGAWNEDNPLAFMGLTVTSPDGAALKLPLADVLRCGAHALAQGQLQQASGGWYYTYRFDDSNQIGVIAPLEALILRADLVASAATVRALAARHGVDDGVLYANLLRLLEDPDDLECRRYYVRRACTSPWRQIRLDPIQILYWGDPFQGYEGVPEDLDQLRAMLSEPGPLGPASIYTELEDRMRPGGAWADRPDGFALLVRASAVPSPMILLTIADLLDIDEAHIAAGISIAVARLRRPDNVPVAVLLQDIALLYFAARRWPDRRWQIHRDVEGSSEGNSIEIDLRQHVPERIAGVLETLHTAPTEVSLGNAEAALLRICQRAVVRLSGPTKEPLRQRLWLTYRLYQWLAAQLNSLPDERRRWALESLCEADKRVPDLLSDKPQDLLDPRRFGHGRLDHRVLAVMHLLGILRYMQMRDVGTNINERGDGHFELLNPQARQRLLSWAAAMLTEEERDVRRLGKSPSTLISEIEGEHTWPGPTTVPELALFVLLTANAADFILLPVDVRLRWIAELPSSVEDADADPWHLGPLIVLGCALSMAQLTGEERSLLRERCEFSVRADVAARDYIAGLIALTSHGEQGLEDVIQSALSRLLPMDGEAEWLEFWWQALVYLDVPTSELVTRISAVLDAVQAAGGELLPLLEILVGQVEHGVGDASVLRRLLSGRAMEDAARAAALLERITKI